MRMVRSLALTKAVCSAQSSRCDCALTIFAEEMSVPFSKKSVVLPQASHFVYV